MRVRVLVMPGRAEIRPVTTSASSSWWRTLTMATMSASPATEYTSATPGTSDNSPASAAIRAGSASISTKAWTTDGTLSAGLEAGQLGEWPGQTTGALEQPDTLGPCFQERRDAA